MFGSVVKKSLKPEKPENTGVLELIAPPARPAEPIAAGPFPVNAGPGQNAQLYGACPRKMSCAKAS